MSILDYQQVEAIASRGEFWILKNLDHLLRQHFAGNKNAAALIELLYINAVLEVAA